MDNVKYIGMDVHKEAISVAVLNSAGKLVMECTIETKASTILDFLKGLLGSLHVTYEEGTWAAWLYDLIKPHVAELVVCNPRRNALLKEGRKSDRIDARKLAELVRSNMVRSEESVQECRDHRRCQAGTVPGVLRCTGGQGNPAGDGASDSGAQDGSHHVDRLEGRSALRRQTSETTNGLSVSSNPFHPWHFSWRWQVGLLGHSGSRASLS
jgi:hypothetical protein